MLVHNNYMYRTEKKIAEKTIWKCIEYEQFLCPGRAHTANDTIIKLTDHNHEANMDKLKYKRFVNKMEEITRKFQLRKNVIVTAVTPISKPVGILGLIK